MDLRYRLRKYKGLWQMSLIGKLFAKLQRQYFLSRVKSARVGKKTKRGGFLLAAVRSIFSTIGYIFRLRFSFVAIGVLILLVAMFISFRYLTLELKPSKFAGENYVPMPIVGSEVNILLLGYDQSDDYNFIDYLAVFSVDISRKSHKLVVLNTNHYVRDPEGQLVRLRAFLNDVPEGENPIPRLMQVMGSLLALNVHRYVAIDVDKLEEYWEKNGLKLLTDETFTDVDAGTFAQGQLLTESSTIANYLAAETPSDDKKHQRLAKFTTSQLQQLFRWLNLPGLIVDPSGLTALMETDLSRIEVANIGLGLMDLGEVSSEEIADADSALRETVGTAYYVPIVSNVDAKLQKIFVRSDVQKEQARVEIFNAARVSGLATKYERMMQNHGGIVIRTGNFPDLEERTKLYAPEAELYVQNVELMREMLNGNLTVVDSEFPGNHTGDLVLVIGTDNAN